MIRGVFWGATILLNGEWQCLGSRRRAGLGCYRDGIRSGGRARSAASSATTSAATAASASHQEQAARNGTEDQEVAKQLAATRCAETC